MHFTCYHSFSEYLVWKTERKWRPRQMFRKKKMAECILQIFPAQLLKIYHNASEMRFLYIGDFCFIFR